ncbi:MAG TPA: hypothetical protein PKC83_03875 [Gemmatimonadaceae bacterium]|jgi:hypothetical protein|nr:MAG: hypothetical protein ABS52_08360 [Gemmatimonadetes bacterium SCN 70-22]HMN07902.1 hypothetical protein [Gemmatimonadaceae bacterium]
MGPEVLVPLGAFAMVTTIVTSVLRYRERMRRADREALMPTNGETSLRLERIEAAIEAIAVEVERISEGQRFVTRLLAERAKDAPAIAPGERHTP